VTSVLVVLDHHFPSGPSTEVLTLARSLGETVTAVWLGEEAPCEEALALAGRYGATNMLVPAFEGLSPHTAAVAAEAVAAAAREVDPRVILLTSSFAGKEIAAGLAVLLGRGAVVDATGARWEGDALVADKTVFGGSWSTTCAQQAPAIVALKPTSVAAVAQEAQETETSVTPLTVEFSARARAVTLLERTERAGTGRVGLTEARTVVVGGRGTDGDFTLVEELADELGGAVGATRVATDEGWIDHSAQVGQTGVTIAPNLYIGLGVSGAIHHTAGMQAAGTIIAVTDDPDAPIFEMADFGIVGTIEDVIPQTLEELRRPRS